MSDEAEPPAPSAEHAAVMLLAMLVRRITSGELIVAKVALDEDTRTILHVECVDAASPAEPPAPGVPVLAAYRSPRADDQCRACKAHGQLRDAGREWFCVACNIAWDPCQA